MAATSSQGFSAWTTTNSSKCTKTIPLPNTKSITSWKKTTKKCKKTKLWQQLCTPWIYQNPKKKSFSWTIASTKYRSPNTAKALSGARAKPTLSRPWNAKGTKNWLSATHKPTAGVKFESPTQDFCLSNFSERNKMFCLIFLPSFSFLNLSLSPIFFWNIQN